MKKKAKAKRSVSKLRLPPVTATLSPAAGVPAALLKLDLGCGPNKQPGHLGVDVRPFLGVDVLLNLGVDQWPWANESVEEAHSSHFLEHLTALERIHFMNELHRVLIPGGKCKIIVPIWSSSRAYGDPTHQWPPIGEMFFMYLLKQWRQGNAPHTDIEHNPQGYSCDFELGATYSMHQEFLHKSQEVQQFAVNFYKEAALDIHATITKVKPPPVFT